MLRHVWIVPLLLAGPALAADPPPSINGMERVPNAKVAMAYMKPGLDLSRYHTIQLLPLSIPPTARNTAPPGTRPEFGDVWILPDKGVARLQKAYDEVTRDELGEGGLRFVTAPQADTLVVAAEIRNIQLNAPIDNTTRSPRSDTFTRGSGAMTLAVVLADGASGKVVAMAQDRKVDVNENLWVYNNNPRNLVEAQRAFREWAALLRARLAQPGTGPKSN